MTDYPPPTFDTTRPHSARVWNYYLGGKDNFPVDRAHGDRTIAIFPQIIDVARASRAFLARAITYLVAEAGVRQFLDVGTGFRRSQEALFRGCISGKSLRTASARPKGSRRRQRSH